MFGRKKRSLDDFDSEIQAHLDLETEEFRKNGFDDQEAHYAALREHGVSPVHRLSFLKKGLH